MFESFRELFLGKEKERKSTAKRIDKNLRSDRQEIMKRMDYTSHEIERVRREMETLSAEARDHLNSGDVDTATRMMGQAYERDKELGVLKQAMQALTAYESTISLLRTRVDARESVSRIAKQGSFLSTGTQRLIERYGKLSEEEGAQVQPDLEHLERSLDSPMYNPALRNPSYRMAGSTIRGMQPQTDEFRKHYQDFVAQLVPVKGK